MSDWYSPAEIVAAAQGLLPGTVRGLNRLAAREGWREGGHARRRPGRGGGQEFHAAVLPGPVAARLALARQAQADARAGSSDLWNRFEALSSRQKSVCEARLKVLVGLENHVAAGMGRTAALRRAAREAGVSVSTLCDWRAKVAGLDAAQWLAALAPEWKGRASGAQCDERAWSALASDFLRPERPSFSACYRRMRRAAAKAGWSPVASEKALRRRLDAEIPQEVQRLAREGREAARAIYPAQTRSRAHLAAMTAVNMDGHRLDLFCRFDGGAGGGRIGRPHLIAIQDLHSGMILAWRLAASENREAVRLVIGDMVERHGIPDKIYLDNGRAFASKWISGGAATRYRFKIKSEEPAGLLTALGIEACWTNPYSGQSKPIERAFRDLADTIARHPAAAGAWTGNAPDAKPENYGDAAIGIEALRALVASEIAEHNERPGRRTETADGRSFAATFAASLETANVRRASSGQRSLWLLAAEAIRANRENGEIHLMENRYWSPALVAQAGRLVTVRFDPDDLARPVLVYDAAGRLVGEAARIAATGFDDAAAAREHAARRSAWLKAAAEQKRLAAQLTAADLARIYASGEPPAAPPVREKITRLAVNGPAAPVPEWGEEQERNFSAGLRIVAGADFDGEV